MKIIFLILFALFAPTALFAATGTIDSVNKYAWSNIAGWVNFAPSQSTITVTDTELTGYAWSANNGWMNLSPSGGGVLNDGGGNLSGSAWDETAGWISFDDVEIDSAGIFTGEATGANGYVLSFDCTNCEVETDWRSSAPPVDDGDNNSSSGSTGSKLQPYPSTPSPREEPIVPPVFSRDSFDEQENVNEGGSSNRNELPVEAPVSVYATNSPELINEVVKVSFPQGESSPLVYTTSLLEDNKILLFFALFIALLLIGGVIRYLFRGRRG